MSRYMTILLSKDIGLDLLNEMGENYNLMFTKVNKRHISNQINDGRMNYYLCQMINGDTIGNTSFNMDSKIIDCISSVVDETFVHKLQSEWEMVRQKSKENNMNFIKFVYELFEKNYISEFDLISHWYNGKIDEESFEIKKIIKITVEELEAHINLLSEEDVLYRISWGRQTVE